MPLKQNQILNNRNYLVDLRKALRNNLTPAEALLWKALQRGQIDNRKFRRQHSFGDYILDFYCPSEKLVVELDGAQHFTATGLEADEERTAFLEIHGIKVIRFENKEVFNNLEGVLQEIRNNFKTIPDPSLISRRV